MAFLGEKYLIQSETGLAIYVSIKDLPILDLHSHIDIKAIAVDQQYSSPWELIASKDHYVWEVLRKRGIEECYISGNASDEEKWLIMAEVFPELAGNPVYEWISLELKRSLGIEEVLGPDTGKSIWDMASEILSEWNCTPRSFFASMNIECACTIDDPLADLTLHTKINDEAGRDMVRPTWRPDKAINIASPDWLKYMNKIEDRYNVRLTSVIDLVYALQLSHNYFEDNGCITSDYSFECPLSGIASEDKADSIFNKAMAGDDLTSEEVRTFMSYMLGEFADMDSESGWVTQIHLGVEPVARDTAIPTVNGLQSSGSANQLYYPLRDFLDTFSDRLKVVLYCQDASQQGVLAALARQYGANISLGSAWWLNDTPIGIRRQMEFIGSIDLLSNFAGMVSDSHKLLSIGSRFEIFRRVLADTLGSMVDLGQMPLKVAISLAERMAYSGPKDFWNL